MKKIYLLSLIVILLLAIVGCSKSVVIDDEQNMDNGDLTAVEDKIEYNITNAVGTVIVIGNGTVDVVLGDIAQRFKVEDVTLLENIKEGDQVEIKFEEVGYNQNTIIEIKIKEYMKICTLEYMPVCGVDGITYGNTCSADEVEIAYVGECSSENAFAEPKKCTREYMPVCGADNVTYSNKCEAGNMQIQFEGVCSN